ncbi:aspartate dehydrogenase [Aeromonas cavernicola]|uniref:L-aspartate dehydrogenase n=1 Tax=Aeromonas cavernicola TaxID=1006623 RepID=A0A2H9U9F3_9GAMM|nr:aspartate dehydrogenase [Aeromonas cavernicola]PJG60654.1 aspartate dehydrogenase [Aeromonas cavernicola]
MKQLMMIGFGAMAREVLALLPADVTLRWLLVPAAKVAQVQAELGPTVTVLSQIDGCDACPDLVVECAGQAAVREHGAAVLARGWSLGLISVGALADEALNQQLRAAAHQGGGNLLVLAGAIAGIDGLAAAREGGLESVTYQGRKSPQSWRGSYAESLIDLNHIAEPTTFFSGSAREAATLFPANANVAATIALAGLGMDRTRVELIVDPTIGRNQHQIKASGRFGELDIAMSGLPLVANPKTSTLAALSVVRACRQCSDSMVI